MLSGSPIDPSLKEPLAPAPAPAPDVQIVPSDPPLPDEPNYVKRLRKIPQVGHLLVFGSCLIMTMAAAFIKVI